ncbi:MAG: hypothetical protein B6D41_08450 [Chloroflexi bacterium UTCFX4]|jgi:uncharacterized damage-inducible protein DinB|nr:MAG: hypothetical protein B6D41_08450 [Chloroflexi bacterium UTCFX4]
MKRDEAIQALRAGRKDLQSALAELGDEDYARSKVTGAWTLQDMLAYLAAWDEEMVRVLQTFPMAGESVYTYTIAERNDFSAWNQDQVERRRAQTLPQTLNEFENARRDLIQVVEGLTDAVLNRSRMTSWGKPLTGFELLQLQVERDRANAELARRYRKKLERWQRARQNRGTRRRSQPKK